MPAVEFGRSIRCDRTATSRAGRRPHRLDAPVPLPRSCRGERIASGGSRLIGRMPTTIIRDPPPRLKSFHPHETSCTRSRAPSPGRVPPPYGVRVPAATARFSSPRPVHASAGTQHSARRVDAPADLPGSSSAPGVPPDPTEDRCGRLGAPIPVDPRSISRLRQCTQRAPTHRRRECSDLAVGRSRLHRAFEGQWLVISRSSRPRLRLPVRPLAVDSTRAVHPVRGLPAVVVKADFSKGFTRRAAHNYGDKYTRPDSARRVELRHCPASGAHPDRRP